MPRQNRQRNHRSDHLRCETVKIIAHNTHIVKYFKQVVTPAFLDLFSLRYFNVLNFVDKL
nr:MAG TPA: hypothetical protein [Caudoviricetes sp.]